MEEEKKKIIDSLKSFGNLDFLAEEKRKNKLQMDNLMKAMEELNEIKAKKELDEIQDRKALVELSAQTTNLLVKLTEFTKQNVILTDSMNNSTNVMLKVVKWAFWIAILSLVVTTINLLVKK